MAPKPLAIRTHRRSAAAAHRWQSAALGPVGAQNCEYQVPSRLFGLATNAGGFCKVAILILLIGTCAGQVCATPGRTSVLSDLQVNEPVAGDVVVFGADLELGPEARVEGDAVAVGGNIRVAPGARVNRHVVAVLGAAEVPRGTDVGGRVLSFSSLATLVPATTDRHHTLGADISMRLLAAGGWLLVCTGLAFLFPIRMRFGAWAVPSLGLRIPALGILVGLTVVASLIAALGLGPALGVPLVAGMMVVFFIAKAVGLTVLGSWLGAATLRLMIHHPLPVSLEVFVGVLLMLVLRFLPVAGETIWNVISLTALGASIAVVGVSPGGLRAEI